MFPCASLQTVKHTLFQPLECLVNKDPAFPALTLSMCVENQTTYFCVQSSVLLLKLTRKETNTIKCKL